MNNKNDNLKEKAIKQEKVMDKNELENVSGGWGEFFGHGKVYHVDTKHCILWYSCKKCMEACCHKAIFVNSGYPYIDQDKCTGCWNCDAEKASLWGNILELD
jgi:bacteriocin-like protein